MLALVSRVSVIARVLSLAKSPLLLSPTSSVNDDCKLIPHSIVFELSLQEGSYSSFFGSRFAVRVRPSKPGWLCRVRRQS